MSSLVHLQLVKTSLTIDWGSVGGLNQGKFITVNTDVPLYVHSLLSHSDTKTSYFEKKKLLNRKNNVAFIHKFNKIVQLFILPKVCKARYVANVTV